MRTARRHAARTESAYGDVLRRTLFATGLERIGDVEAALEEVLTGVIRRVQPEEGRHVLAQLPILLRDRLAARLTGPDRSISRASIERSVARRLELDLERAREIVEGVGDVVMRTVAPR